MLVNCIDSLGIGVYVHVYRLLSSCSFILAKSDMYVITIRPRSHREKKANAKNEFFTYPESVDS